MPIKAALEEIEKTLKLMDTELSGINQFSTYSYVSGPTNKTGQFTFIIHEAGEPPKKRIKLSEAVKIFDTYISKCDIPALNDKKFLPVLQCVCIDSPKQIMTRDEVFEFLKTQAAAFNINICVVGNLKYKFNHLSHNTLKVKTMKVDGSTIICVAAADLKEDGLLVLIEDKLKQIKEELDQKRSNAPINTNGGNGAKSIEPNVANGSLETKSPTVEPKESEKTQPDNEEIKVISPPPEEIPKSTKPKATPGGFFGPPVESNAELKEENKQLKVALYDEQQKTQALQQEIENLKQQITNFKAQIIENSMTQQKLNTQNQKLSSEFENLSKDLAAITQEKGNLKSEIEKLEEKIAGLEQDKRVLSQQKEELEKDKKELEELSKKEKENIENLKKDLTLIEQKKNEIEGLKSKIEEEKTKLQHDIEELQKSNKSGESKIDEITKLSEKYKLKIESLEKELAELKTSSEKEKTHLNEIIKINNEKALSEKKELEDKIQAAISKQKDLKEEIKKHESRNKEIEEQLTKSDKKIKELQDELDNLRKTVSSDNPNSS